MSAGAGSAKIADIVVASDKLERAKVWGEDDPSVRWQGAFASCGGKGATQSSTIVYEIEPGGRLGCIPTRRKRRSTSSREAAR